MCLLFDTNTEEGCIPLLHYHQIPSLNSTVATEGMVISDSRCTAEVMNVVFGPHYRWPKLTFLSSGHLELTWTTQPYVYKLGSFPWSAGSVLFLWLKELIMVLGFGFGFDLTNPCTPPCWSCLNFVTLPLFCLVPLDLLHLFRWFVSFDVSLSLCTACICDRNKILHFLGF